MKDDSLSVKCPKCGKEIVMKGLAAWSYIILRYTVCTCGEKVYDPERKD